MDTTVLRVRGNTRNHILKYRLRRCHACARELPGLRVHGLVVEHEELHAEGDARRQLCLDMGGAAGWMPRSNACSGLHNVYLPLAVPAPRPENAESSASRHGAGRVVAQP